MTAHLQEKLEEKVSQLENQGLDAELKVSFYDLKEGTSASVNGKKTGWAASVIKVPVLVAVARDIEEGKLDLEEHLEVDHTMTLETFDYVSRLPDGTTLPVSEYLRTMISWSDNEATNILAKKVGLNRINTFMWQLGLDRTMLGHLLYAGAERFSTDFNPDGSNITCTDDLVLLMRQIYDKDLATLTPLVKGLSRIVLDNTSTSFVSFPNYPSLVSRGKIGSISDPIDGNDTHEVGIISERYIVALMANKIGQQNNRAMQNLVREYRTWEGREGKEATPQIKRAYKKRLVRDFVKNSYCSNVRGAYGEIMGTIESECFPKQEDRWIAGLKEY